MAYRISVDTGGTFTDVVVADERGIRALGKAPTTPDRIFRGMQGAIENAASDLGLDLKALFAQSTTLIYGTTRAVNAIVQGKTAKTAFLVTEGFPDTLVLREGGKTNPHDFTVEFPPPYVPRRYTFEIPERVSSEGEITRALDMAATAKVIDQLKSRGFEAVAVCLLWSVANPAHEVALGRMIEEKLPGVPFTLSHRLIPIVREYRRASATAIDASLKPLMQRHLRDMENDLRAAGFGGEILVSTSIGGCMHVEELVERPIHTVKSGPAMAPVAGRTYSRVEDLGKDSIVCDTGGTTFDVGLVRDNELVFTRDSWLGPRWTGHIMSMSTVDVRSIGAGGGSIAYVPELTKALRVGPQSAGAVPGPAAYMKGGEKPTVTDANVVLGYLPASSKLGGDMRIDRGLAEKAVQSIANAIGLPLMTAAEGIIDIVNENMFGALRLVSIERGYDPRDFALVAFGGAGPLHANALGKLMQSWPVIIPPGPGVLCAYGDATTRLRDEASKTFIRRFSETSDAEVLQHFETLAETAARTLSAEGIAPSDQSIGIQIDLRYHGQGMVLTIDSTIDEFRKGGLTAIGDTFDAMHEQLFTFALEHQHELVNLRAIAQGREARVSAEQVGSGASDASAAMVEHTEIYVAGSSRSAAIYDRSKLKAGNRIAGPAIVVQMDTTTLILPDHVGEVDAHGSILIRPVG